jgi:rhodanese-related sulfurtransferase
MIEADVVTVVEVLGAAEYGRFHLPGALNVPVAGDFARDIQGVVPDRRRPVAVYCLDAECGASPRAADMLERLGYGRVYDYAAGKRDWQAAGLPVEGHNPAASAKR